MANDYKKDSLYVFGVVCANGVQDSWGDTLTKQDIKKLISSYKNHEIDTNHNYLKNIGVSVIESYITKVPMIIGGKDVPVGSWVMGLLVWDETLKEGIRSGELNGYSLCSRPATPELMIQFFNDENPPNYRDFDDKDDLNPIFVSLVNGAGNGYTIEYTTYYAYIERGKKEENPMSENDFDKYLQFMDAVDKYWNTHIQRNNPAPEKDEEIENLKKELEEQKKSYEAIIEKQNADKEEIMNAISELKEGQETDNDPAPNPQNDNETNNDESGNDESGNEGKGDNNDEQVDINRGNPNDFQTNGEVGNPKPKTIPVDKFFDDGFVPRNRGYGGLPL